MNKRAALILAGGKAERFQLPNQPWQDKALAQIGGEPLLVKAVQNIHEVVDEIVICVNSEERKNRYSQLLKQQGAEKVQFVIDLEDYPVKGPALAIVSGLQSISSEHCLTLPVDMPFMKAEVVEYMFAASRGFDVVVPMWPDGTIETLVMTLDRKKTLNIAQTLCALNKPRANNLMRGASKLLLVSPLQKIKTFDPDFRSFININSGEDLSKLPPRSTEGGLKENRVINRGSLSISAVRRLGDGAKFFSESNLHDAKKVFEECQMSFVANNHHFWVALSAEKKAEVLRGMDMRFSSQAKEAFAEAAASYESEAQEYVLKGCKRLAECAVADKEFCQAQTID